MMIVNTWHTMRVFSLITILLCSFFVQHLYAQTETWHVDASQPDDSGAGTNWITAKQTIQAAVDLAGDGDLVMVTNGTYNSGCRVTPGYALSNRVVVTQNITVQSVNGPELTIIEGNGPLSNVAVRCVFITNGVLSGFTLTNGYTGTSGDWTYDCSGAGCFSQNAIITNCIISGNTAYSAGGGAYRGSLIQCTLSGNRTEFSGGGASYATLHGCTVSANVSELGAGVIGSVLNNCSLFNNHADSYGGGAFNSTINHCTLSENTAVYFGGGIYNCSASNSIIYHNTTEYSQQNYSETEIYSLHYCCTTPMPDFGIGNITNDPVLVDFSHISIESPCIGAGYPTGTTGCDIDRDAWANPPSIGCDEYVESSAVGELSVAIDAVYTRALSEKILNFKGSVDGHALSNKWCFGDGVCATNIHEVSHSWATNGTYDLIFTAYNLDYSSGISVTQTIDIVTEDGLFFYVSTNSPSPMAPFTSWTTAAHCIQDAIEATSNTLSATVWVTNGLYNTGSYVTPGADLHNRVVITQNITVCSVNGPEKTIIEGAPPLSTSVRCVYITDGTLSGFTLTNGHTYYSGSLDLNISGGGCFAEGGIISNCLIVGNEAVSDGGGAYSKMGHDGIFYNCTLQNNSAQNGGGAINGTFTHCVISDNMAILKGGGVVDGSLSNCVLFNNTGTVGGGMYKGNAFNCGYMNNYARDGGGVDNGTLVNCTLVANTAEEIGGGVKNSSLENCILWNNINLTGATSNYYVSAISFSCTTPLPMSGIGNINENPLFMDLVNSNFHLQIQSPCIDIGQNDTWMQDAVDLDGHPRVINGRVDMGAYEFCFDVGVRALLQGPYSTNLHAMSATLSNAIPLSSLYADDPRTVTAVPDNAVDWVLLQTRPSPSNAPTFSRSVFITDQGDIVSATGDTNLLIEVTPGSTNYLVVAHRNHLMSMSAQPVVFTNQTFAYDFSSSADTHLGTTNSVVEVEAGRWALFAGDADGDGWCSPIDQSICTTQVGTVGYSCADYTLDGSVDANDLALILVNSDQSCAFDNAEVAFSPALTMDPARKTIVSEDSLTLTASGSTNAITWFDLVTDSGGTASTLTATSALYQAGSTSEVVDIIEAWDGDYRFARSYMNVIDSSSVSSYGKAVVLAGRVSASDPLWDATDYLAGTAYNTLLYRGFSRDTVQYLSAVTNRDVDGDGLYNDIDQFASVENTETTFTNWVYDAEKLFVYFVDHGTVDGSGNAYLRLNPAEILAAATLDSWLDAFQDTQNKDVTVVIDCCYAARFMEELSYTGSATRIVIAAAGTNEPAYYMANGLVSFSDAFFSGIMSGNDVAQSYASAASAMSAYQQAGYDDNAGGNAAEGLYLGATFVAGRDTPHIGLVCGNQLLSDSMEASLWAADVISAYALERVWCAVVPPDHNPTNPAQAVIDILELELTYNPESGHYEGTYSDFSEPGSYKIMHYAQDIWGSVSPPVQSYVMQSISDERFIMVGGGETNWACWNAINNLANYTYNAMQRRGMDKEHLYYLSAWTNQDVDLDGGSDVSASAILDNLGNAITNWAMEADSLTVYLIGAGSNDLYHINASETLDATTLDGWLDVFQVSNSTANVIMDFSGSGAFVPYMQAPGSAERITIAGAMAEREATMAADGMISFTRLFMSEVANGETVGDAYDRAQRGIRRTSGSLRQNARIDDNGNGIPNEKNTDRTLARTTYLGPAFVTGNEIPTIGAITPETVLTNINSLLLWASDISDPDSITNCWCTIVPPSYGFETNDITETLSWNAGTERYETLYSGFAETGTYACTFYIQNDEGAISLPNQTLVEVVYEAGTGPDSYEVDDTWPAATPFYVGTIQPHTLHADTDEDWVRFYGLSNCLYDIETSQGTNQIDTIITLYRGLTNGTLEEVDQMDEYGYDQGEILPLDYPDNGVYYVRISSTNYIEPGSYNLTIAQVVTGGENDFLMVIALNNLTQRAIGGDIRVRLYEGYELPLNADGSIMYQGIPDGVYDVTLSGIPAGWEYVNYAAVQHLQIPNGYNNYSQLAFTLQPMINIYGTTRDGCTGEWLANVEAEFLMTSHAIAGYTYDVYTGSDGCLQNTQTHAAVNYEITFSHADYSNLTVVLNAASMSAGSSTNLGDCLMAALDSNGNGFPDAWEAQYFGPGTNVETEADADGDGYSNYVEYRLGTDPTNAWSLLAVDDALDSTNGVFDLEWAVAPGRTYAVSRTPMLGEEAWSVVYGPVEATNGQSRMQWSDSDAGTNYFYRIDCRYEE